MSFFDKKQEVIDIKLTKHGRELLSKGLFKPYYYNFFDQDIIYDSDVYQSANSELQNAIQERIINETLTAHPQTSIIGSKFLHERYTQDDYIRTNNLLGPAIGTSDGNSIYYPAWDIQFIQGSIGSINLTSSQYRSNYEGDKFIPQIDISETQTQIIINKEFSPIETFNDEFESNNLTQKGDGSHVKIKNASIMLKIEEKNSINIGENFEIEIFKVSYKENKQELTKLHFYKYVESTTTFGVIQNDLLVEENTTDFFINETTTFDEEANRILNQDELNVQNYFFVSVDEEIPPDQIEPNRLDLYNETAYSLEGECAPSSFRETI
jgi:hypothetical protein